MGTFNRSFLSYLFTKSFKIPHSIEFKTYFNEIYRHEFLFLNTCLQKRHHADFYTKNINYHVFCGDTYLP